MTAFFLVLCGVQIGWSAITVQLPPTPEVGKGGREPSPKLYVEQRLHQLGPILGGDVRTVSWVLENHGDAPLIIDRTRASCGCTVVKLKEAEKVIPPGKRLELKAEFNSSGRHGKQSKSITVYSNDPAEPTLTLRFTTTVETLYEIDPPGLVNLRTVRRGERAARTIDILPGSQRGMVEILDLKGTPQAPLDFAHETVTKRGRTGQRIRMTVNEDVPLGRLSTSLIAKIRVGDVERERKILIRGQVVGDLTWRPTVVDNTRQPSRPGKRFPSVTVRSSSTTPFDITEASAGARFDVRVVPMLKKPKGTHYSVSLVLRDDAPVGPFATTLELHTTSLDQPLIRIPVFGNVAPPITVEPALIALRADGTPSGQQRRVRLEVAPQWSLEILSVTANLDAVSASLDNEASGRYRHLGFLNVRLVHKPPEGRHTAMLSVSTNVPGAEHLEIPIRIDVPAGAG